MPAAGNSSAALIPTAPATTRCWSRLTDETVADRGHDRELCLPSDYFGVGKHADKSRLCRCIRELVEGATAAPMLVSARASGDLGPQDGYVGDTRVADRNGRELGYSALGGTRVARRAGQRLSMPGRSYPEPPSEPGSMRRYLRKCCAASTAGDGESVAIDLDYRANLPTHEDTEGNLTIGKSRKTGRGR